MPSNASPAAPRSARLRHWSCRYSLCVRQPPQSPSSTTQSPQLHHQFYRSQRFFNRGRSRRYSFKGRAGRPQKTSPGPRIFLPLNTPAPPPRITPAPTVACSPIPTWPPRIAPSSTTLDPEIPVCAAITTCSPMTQLCPMWTRLSIFVPRPIRVSPRAPRSMVVFAPISTSSSTTSRPCCGKIRYSPVSLLRAYPNPVDPSTAPACTTTRPPSTTPVCTTTRAIRLQSLPTTAPSSSTTPGPILVPPPILTPSPTTAEGWTPALNPRPRSRCPTTAKA